MCYNHEKITKCRYAWDENTLYELIIDFRDFLNLRNLLRGVLLGYQFALVSQLLISVFMEIPPKI